MSKRRKPTGRDLLVIVGVLQDLIGEAKAQNNDRNPDRQADVDAALDTAHKLCIEVRSHFQPIDTRFGPWGVVPSTKRY